MPITYHFHTDQLKLMLNPSRCADYYNQPQLLESDIKQLLTINNHQSWPDQFSLDDDLWLNDFRQLVDNFVQQQSLDYQILERYCHRADYAAIDQLKLDNGYPQSTLPNWSIRQQGPITQLVLVAEWQWAEAITRLILLFLFYNFHALQARATNYKFSGGNCLQEDCGQLYLSRTSGSQTKFCSKKCKNRHNVKQSRLRQKAGK